jgi:general secretion pathway protein D
MIQSCGTNPALQESKLLMTEGRAEDAVLRLERAMREDPNDREIRAQYFRQRDIAAAQLLATAETKRAANRYDSAEDIYKRVQKLDPANPRVRDGLAAMAVQRRHTALMHEIELLMSKQEFAAAERLLRTVQAESPAHPQARKWMEKIREQKLSTESTSPVLKAAYNKPITLEFRDTPLRTVFEVISRSSGLNFVFDKDVRSDIRVTIFIRNAGVEEVVKLILTTNQLERKLLNENSILIYPNTPAKAKDYLELVTRTFYLANADVKQAQSMIRTLVKTKDVFTDEKLNLLIIKDTAEAVKLAERLIESLDMAEPEVMLEVEVLEVTRSKLLELGIRFPDQIGYGILQPTTNTTIVNGNVTQSSTVLGGTLAPGFVDLNNSSGQTAFVVNPSLLLNLKDQVGDGNLLANPRIRVRNREKAKIHIGDKLPVFTTTSTANVGVAASVSYLDVGLKLEVEPNVYLDDDVAIKVGLEVSSIVKEIPGPASSLAYQIGTRSAATVLRLRNGETQVLAGLISDEERSSANRLPGLGDVPLLGRLFSSQKDSSSKTEIILLITPRIVRNLVRPQSASETLPAGSESSVGAPPLLMKPTQARGLSLSYQRPSGGTPQPAPEPVPVPSEPESALKPTEPEPETATLPTTSGTSTQENQSR